jgi:hypothetical protein
MIPKEQVAVIAIVFALAAAGAQAETTSLGAMTGGSLASPSYNVIGKTAPLRLRTIAPRTVLRPEGPISIEAESRTFGRRDDESDRLLIERRLDCFDESVPPDRDDRNRFLTPCPATFE